MLDFLQFMQQWGLPGVIIGLLCVWIWTKDRTLAKTVSAKDDALKELNEKLQAEVSLRVEDAKQYTKLALDLQSDVKESVHAVTKSADENSKLSSMVERLINSVERLIDRRGAGG